MARGRTDPPINSGSGIRSNLRPEPTPLSSTGCRVISVDIWTSRILPRWLRHVAARHIGAFLPAPFIGNPLQPDIYITDEESLDGYSDPAHIARRLGVPLAAHAEFQQNGCVIIAFRIANPASAVLPPRNPSSPLQGLIVGDAREWTIPNTRLDVSMDVTYIGISPRGNPFWYTVPLTD